MSSSGNLLWRKLLLLVKNLCAVCMEVDLMSLTQIAIFTFNSQRIPNKLFQKADKPPFLNYS